MMRIISAFLFCFCLKASAQVDSTANFRTPAKQQIVLSCSIPVPRKEVLYIIDGVVAGPTEMKQLRTGDVTAVTVLHPENYLAFSCTPAPGYLIVIATRQQVLRITDADDGHPVEGATVSLKSPGMKGFSFKTDSAGSVDLGLVQLVPGYELEVSCIGYRSQKITWQGKKLVRSVQLQKDFKRLQEVVITEYAWTKRTSCGTVCSRMGIAGEQQDISGQSLVTFYPNPAPRHGMIHPDLLQNGDNLIEIVNSIGCVVQKFSVADGKTDLQLNLNSAGTYFVRITHQQTKKSTTGKLLVQ